MGTFSDYLEVGFDRDKIIEKEDCKDQEFMISSTRNWNRRRNGIPFVDRKLLSYNQILLVDFGFGYKPELAYAHPCLLLTYANELCKVLPITSGSKHVSVAYHPTIRPLGNKAYYLIPNGVCSLNKDSIVLIRQLRTISESRIIRILDGNGLPSDMYDDIRMASFEDTFPDISRLHMTLLKSAEP